MPDPADQPTPATPDELAALYLRDRDVPCARCGYNRRGGTVAACPECLHPLKVSNNAFELDPQTGRIASAVSAMIACCGAVVCASVTLLILDDQWRKLSDVIAIVVMVGSICCSIMAMNRAVNARATHDLRFLRHFLVLLGIGIVAFSFAIVIALWRDLF